MLCDDQCGGIYLWGTRFSGHDYRRHFEAVEKHCITPGKNYGRLKACACDGMIQSDGCLQSSETGE